MVHEIMSHGSLLLQHLVVYTNILPGYLFLVPCSCIDAALNCMQHLAYQSEFQIMPSALRHCQRWPVGGQDSEHAV